MALIEADDDLREELENDPDLYIYDRGRYDKNPVKGELVKDE